MEFSIEIYIETVAKNKNAGNNNPGRKARKPARKEHFLSLDVETANTDNASICQIGIAEYENNKLINQWSTLVDPEEEFDPFNVSIHGITEHKVKGEPLFTDIYPTLQKILVDCVVVTHSTFDQSSLRQAAEKYNFPELDCIWLDSTRVVRRQWQQFRTSGYGLPNVANFLGIEYKPHDALEDAKAAGEVVIKAIEESGMELESWLDRAYQPIQSSKSITSKPLEGDPDGPFWGENIVFTGSLSFPRNKAFMLAAAIGCNVSDNVNKNTTILVVGNQNQKLLADHDKSSKHRKAEELIKKGHPIKILTEKDFFAMLGT